MTSNPPQLGSIPAIDEIKYPNTSSNTASTTQNVKNSFAESEVSCLVPTRLGTLLWWLT